MNVSFPSMGSPFSPFSPQADALRMLIRVTVGIVTVIALLVTGLVTRTASSFFREQSAFCPGMHSLCSFLGQKKWRNIIDEKRMNGPSRRRFASVGIGARSSQFQ
jgi:hypothetical protein